jgi:hypothetical protein
MDGSAHLFGRSSALSFSAERSILIGSSGSACAYFAPLILSLTHWEPFMKLKLVADISPLQSHAQQGGPQPTVPKPTKADAQKVGQIITSDNVKTPAYCDLTKLEGQVKAVEQKNDTKTLEALSKQAESLLDKLGPEYFKLMDGLEQVDPKSNEAKEFMSILSELDKSCTK